MRNPPVTREKARLWLMGIVTATLIPALFLGLLETGLRLAGFGYPTRFLITETIEGEAHHITNHRFTYRFFPQALARAITPMRIPVRKPEDTYRIIVFGESAANGDPDPAYGFGRQLEVLLNERFPETRFEVVSTAITAINSHVILPIARECASLESDLWIVYMGNNEIIGPYGPGTIFGAKAPPLPAVRASLAVKRTRTGQLIDTLMQQMRTDSANPETWGGINMFAENPLRPDDAGRQQAYAAFERNLRDILKAGEQAGVPVLLSTIAVNLRDCAPFTSLPDDSLSKAQTAEWAAVYAEAQKLEQARSWAEAAAAYTRAAEIDPGHAETHFRRALSLGYSGDWAEAGGPMQQAVDTDALAVRADSRINRIIREAATKAGSHVALVDPAGELAARSPGGIPGHELFYEHVHFTIEGNYQLARVFAERIHDLLPEGIAQADQGSWVKASTCQRKLAVSVWDQNRVWSYMGERLSTPPFTARSNNGAELARTREQADESAARIDPRIDRIIYQFALKDHPDDYHLRNRYGHYLLANGFFDEAINEFTWVCDRHPDFAGGHQDLGIALLLAERYSEAKVRFERVLELRPGYARAEKALEVIRNTTEPSGS